MSHSKHRHHHPPSSSRAGPPVGLLAKDPAKGLFDRWGAASCFAPLVLVLLVLPFIYTGGLYGVRIAKMLAFVLFGGLFGAVFFAQQVHLALGLIYGAVVVSALQAGFGPVHATALCFATSGAFFAVYASRFALSELRPFFNVMLIVGAIQAVYGYGQMLGFDPLFQRAQSADMWLPVGSLGQQTLYGPFMVAAVCVALYRKPLLLLLLLPVTLCTLSSMTYLALIGVFTVYVFSCFGTRGVVALCGVLASVGGATYLLRPDLFLFDVQGRLEVWRQLLSLWYTRPWFGWGIGSYQVVAPVELPRALVAKHGLFLQAHNDYLQVLFELGVVGALSVGYALYEFARGARRAFVTEQGKIVVSIFVALAINALGSFPLHAPPLALLLILSWTWVVTSQPAKLDQEGVGAER